MQGMLADHDKQNYQAPGGRVVIRWVRLTEWVGPNSDWADRNATEQFLDPTTGIFEDTDPAVNYTVVTDPLEERVFPLGSIVPCECHWSGRLVPIAGNAITLYGKTTGAITGSSSTATTSYDIYDGPPNSGGDSGVTVPDAWSFINLDSGIWIKLTWVWVEDGGFWLIEPLECNT